MKLNLGSSSDLRGGDWINVDLVEPTECTSGVRGAQIQIADLALPWPWEDSGVDEIYAADIAEHIGDCPHVDRCGCDRCDKDERCDLPHRHWSGRIHFANECWRVLKAGGLLTLECPDAAKGAGQWQDPTHTTPWTPNGLQYFADGSPAHKRFAKAYGITARFRVLGCTERKYTETAGGPGLTVTCEVWKFRAALEAVK